MILTPVSRTDCCQCIAQARCDRNEYTKEKKKGGKKKKTNAGNVCDFYFVVCMGENLFEEGRG